MVWWYVVCLMLLYANLINVLSIKWKTISFTTQIIKKETTETWLLTSPIWIHLKWIILTLSVIISSAVFKVLCKNITKITKAHNNNKTKPNQPSQFVLRCDKCKNGKPFIKICWCLCEWILCKTHAYYLYCHYRCWVWKQELNKYRGIGYTEGSKTNVYYTEKNTHIYTYKTQSTPIAFLTPLTKCLWLKLNTVVWMCESNKTHKWETEKSRKSGKPGGREYPAEHYWCVGGFLRTIKMRTIEKIEAFMWILSN